MPTILDAEIGISAQALQLQAKRLQLLATNIANADTPGYKARDIDFRSALNRAEQLANAPNGAATPVAPSTDLSPSEVKYRMPLAPSLDGNTVDVQLEQAAFADATVRYQTSLAFVSDSFRGLMLAITGQ